MTFKNKYKPTTLADLVIEPQNKRILEQYTKKEVTDHLIIEGTNGTGKTTVAELLPQLTHGDAYSALPIQGHKDVVIDNEQIQGWNRFYTYCHMQGDAAYIVINELDKIERILPLFWQWLDQVSDKVTVIATTNRLTAIEKAIRSRMKCLSFGAVTASQMLSRAMEILSLEGLSPPSDYVWTELRKVESMGDIRKYLERLEQIALVLRSSPNEVELDMQRNLLRRVK